ncbi:hypothetical protein, partial [Lysinibacillus sp. GbtcB16]|uniref:hypothetical protein n=1 Tax=Lysinibacillus sp. GbtcB16 TaxID=2824761 RepID=UPI001C3079DF
GQTLYKNYKVKKERYVAQRHSKKARHKESIVYYISIEETGIEIKISHTILNIKNYKHKLIVHI